MILANGLATSPVLSCYADPVVAFLVKGNIIV